MSTLYYLLVNFPSNFMTTAPSDAYTSKFDTTFLIYKRHSFDMITDHGLIGYAQFERLHLLFYHSDKSRQMAEDSLSAKFSGLEIVKNAKGSIQVGNKKLEQYQCLHCLEVRTSFN